MDYVTLSTSFYLRLADLSPAALGIYAGATALSGHLESDGILSEAQLATLPGGKAREAAVKELLAAGVLIQQNGTYVIADYSQVSHQSLEEKRQNARAAAEARWKKERAK